MLKQAEIVRKPLQDAENVAAKSESREAVSIPLEVDLPKFTFNFENHFADTYKNKLSNTARTILASHDINEQVSLEEAKLSLQERMDVYINQLANLTITKTKSVYVNGVKLYNKATTALDSYCYLVKIVKVKRPIPILDPNPPGDLNIDDNGQITDVFINDIDGFSLQNLGNGIFPKSNNGELEYDSILFKINLGAANASVVSQTHTLTPNQITDSVTELINLSNGVLIIRLFPTNEDLSFPINSTINVTGQFVLNNGTILNYNVDIDTNVRTASGCIDIGNTGGNNDGNSGTSNTDPVPNPIIKLYGIGKVGVADFRKVEQEVCCYVPGEVSHIENILAKEFKKRETRSLVSSETTTETTSEKEVENLSDTTTTERNELQAEVSNVLNEEDAQSYGMNTGVSGTFPSGSYSVDANANFANSSSSAQSNSQSQSYAQEITERALERVVTKTSKKQTSRILKEFEENNQHGFDNRKGDQHVSGVYRWVDIIYKNQLINYGKRLMYEFMIPEPARFYRDAITMDNDFGSTDNENFIIVNKPIHPSLLETIGIDSATQLTKDNYLTLASIYDVEIAPIPEEFIFISEAFSFYNDTAEHNADSKTTSVSIPKNYKAIQFFIDGGHTNTNGTGKYSISVANVNLGGSNDVTNENKPLNNIIDAVSVAIAVDRYYSIAIGVSIKCHRTNEALQQWQNTTYKTILNGYDEQVNKYNDYLTAKGLDQAIAGDKEQLRFSNSFNRILEVREIKRICIEMLVTPYFNPYDQDNYNTPDANGIAGVKQDAAFENHAAHVKFFEQAFDWDIMAYRFYDYFWANKDQWMPLFQQTSKADPIFQAFLQSGMARAVVPVKSGFEDAVVYYIETGDIWLGGDLVIDQDNDLYISIADEMQHIEGKVEKTWETRVPTALTIIQKDTIGLEETGLPCCNDGNASPEDKPIQAKITLLGGDNPIDSSPL